MTRTTKLDLAWESLQALGLALAADLTGRPVPASVDDATCVSISDTVFALEWPFHESTHTIGNDTPSSCAGTDWIVLAILTLVVHAINVGGRRYVWDPLALFLARRHYHNTTSSNNDNPKTLPPSYWTPDTTRRWSAAATGALFFLASGMLVGRLIGPEPWLWTPSAWCAPLVNRVTCHNVRPSLRLYYLLYAARFVSDSCMLLCVDDRTTEALVTTILHHAITLGLVLGSAGAGATRIGSVVMFFFDWADVPLLVAKLCKYLSLPPSFLSNQAPDRNEDVYGWAANRLFELFAVVFVLTRNVLFTYVVVVAVRDLPDWMAWASRLLVLLAGLQTYWLGLLIRAIQRQRKNGGVVEDVRDDGLDENDTTTDGTAAKPKTQ